MPPCTIGSNSRPLSVHFGRADDDRIGYVRLINDPRADIYVPARGLYRRANGWGFDVYQTFRSRPIEVAAKGSRV